MWFKGEIQEIQIYSHTKTNARMDVQLDAKWSIDGGSINRNTLHTTICISMDKIHLHYYQLSTFTE